MRKVIFLFLILIVLSISPFAHAHKLISHDDSHRDFESALVIPDHKISWAIYDNLGVEESKFYTFDAKKDDSFYASIVIPKLEGLENYSPSLILMNDDLFNGAGTSSNIESSVQKFLYEGDYPGNEFYEPFGQVTYWERQEVTTIIPADGQYFILVSDEKNQIGKYALAVGTIEDIKDFRYPRSNNQRKKKRDHRKSWRNRNWVELVEISVKDIKQIQFQIKSDMKLDKKDVHFAEFSYL